jgi:hypothetical protein
MDKRSGEAFFFSFAVTALLVVVLSFGIHAVIRAGQLPPFSLPLVIHATLMVGWYGLFAVQAGLVRSDNVSFHMRLGKLSAILAAGIVISGLVIMAEHYQRKGEPLVAMSNIMAMVCFAGFYTAAVANRKKPVTHKRLMTFASIFMLAPALTRFARAFDLGEGIILPLWLLAVVSVILYDVLKLKKVHIATVIGGCSFVIAVVLMIAVGTSGTWKAFLDSMLR